MLGLQLSAPAGDGQAALEELLRHHAIGRSGLALVPQGTPAHNTSGTGTGYTRRDDPDQSFDDRKNAPLFTPTADPTQKRDGQWLAELLGVDPALFAGVHGSGGKDQMQARAMQRALWPATIGYWMDKLLAPVFSDETDRQTRAGSSPSSSAAAARCRRSASAASPTASCRRRRSRASAGSTGAARRSPASAMRRSQFLRVLLRDPARRRCRLDRDERRQRPCRRAGRRASDAARRRRAASVVGRVLLALRREPAAQLFNIANLWGLGPDFVQRAERARAACAAPPACCARLGYTGAAQPDILQHYFLRDAGQITQVIDDRPLSETDPIRAYTDDGRNYIQWLIDAASTSLEALRAEQGFTDNTTPQALLYLYLRHALMLGYYDTSYELHKSAGFLTAAQLAAMKPEPPSCTSPRRRRRSESRFAALYKTEAASPAARRCWSATTSRAISASCCSRAGSRTRSTRSTILADAPTADLERAFAEHVDTLHLPVRRLAARPRELSSCRRMRYGAPAKVAAPRTGVYLGAYAWVEDLRPSTARPVPARLPPISPTTFPAPPIMHDPANGGYIHAPSLTQARTAAVLRSGYLANATAANPQTTGGQPLVRSRAARARRCSRAFATDRASARCSATGSSAACTTTTGWPRSTSSSTRCARRFRWSPIALAPTKTAPDVPIEAIEARNVLDGRKLVDADRKQRQSRTYPFGLADAAGREPDRGRRRSTPRRTRCATSTTRSPTSPWPKACTRPCRATSTASPRRSTPIRPATSRPSPQVVQTPPGGIGLTHRVAVQLKPGLAAPAGATPRAQAEPALDDWLASMLPPLAQDRLHGRLDRSGRAAPAAAGGDARRSRAAADRSAVRWSSPTTMQAMTELDDRVLRLRHRDRGRRGPTPICRSHYMTARLPTSSASSR